MENVAPYFTRPDKFPYRTAVRIKIARALFDVENGPLYQFRDRVIALFEEMKDHELNRHVMAHGYIDVTVTNGDPAILIRCFRPTKEDPAQEILQRMSLNQMEAAAKQATEFTGRWLELFFDIHSFFGWVAPANAVVSQSTRGMTFHRTQK